MRESLLRSRSERHRHRDLEADRGNAVLEFILFFSVALVLIVALTSNFEANLRSRAAALNIANQSLRAWQLSSSRSSAEEAAADVAAAFQLTSGEWSVDLDFACSISSRFAAVTAKVGGVTEHAQGSC